MRLPLWRVLILCFVGVAVSVSLWFGGKVLAGTADNVFDWAWSETIGWLSFNCTNDHDAATPGVQTCTDLGGSDYGVNVDRATGILSGYAWSENIGWVKVNPASLYPASPFQSARIDLTPLGTECGSQFFSCGWIRACAAVLDTATCEGTSDPAAGGWDGWIKLRGEALISDWVYTFNPSSGNETGDIELTIEEIRGATVDTDDAIYTGGLDFTYGAGDVVWQTMKISPDGTEAWRQVSNPSVTKDLLQTVLVDASGVYAIGTSRHGTASNRWYVEVRDKSTGFFMGTVSDTVGSVGDAAIHSSGIYILGTDSLGNLRAEKRDNTAGLIWGKSLTGANASEGGIAVDDTGVYVTGKQISPSAHWRILKWDLGSWGPGGGATPVWDVTNGDPSPGSDVPLGIALDDSGVYIVGYDRQVTAANPDRNSDGSGSFQWRIEKRDKTTGALVPGFGVGGVIQENPTNYTGEEDDSDVLWDVIADGSNLYVIGTELSTAYSSFPGDARWRIEKRAADTGLLLESFIVNPTITREEGRFIAKSQTSSKFYIGGGDRTPGGPYTDPSDGTKDGQFRIEKRELVPYGVQYDTAAKQFNGWAWGGDVIGWLSFNGAGYAVSVVNALPSATNLTVQIAGYCGRTAPPVIVSWDFTDSDIGGDTQSAYQVQFDNTSDFSSPEYDSGKVIGSNTSHTPILSFGSSYYWRVKVWDSSDAESPWVEYNDPADPDGDGNSRTFTTPPHAYPQANFQITPENPVLEEQVKFKDTSVCSNAGGAFVPCSVDTNGDGDPDQGADLNGDSISDVSFAWDVNNDGITDSTAPTYFHSYPSISSTMTAKLTVIDDAGNSCSLEKSFGVDIRFPDWREVSPL